MGISKSPGDVATYERQINISSSMPQTRVSDAGAKSLAMGADVLQKAATDIDDRITENATAQAENVLAENVARMERDYAADPAALEEALNSYKETFFEEIYDTRTADRMGMQYDRTALLALERTKDAQQRVIDDQAQVSALQSLNNMEREFAGVSASIFSPNPQVSAAAQASLQEVMDRLATTLNQKDSKGQFMFSPEARVNKLEAAKDSALSGAAIEWISQQPDKDAAIESIKKGDLKLALPDGEGGVDEISITDSLSPRAVAVLESEAKRQKEQQKKALLEANEADEATQMKNQNDLLTLMDDPKTSLDDKAFKINEMDLKGQITPKFATEARRYISSAKKVNAKTDNGAMAGIVTKMYDLNALSDVSDKDYLLGVQNIKQEIMTKRADGTLSAEDETKLNNQMKTLMSAKVSDATQAVATSFGSARQIIETSLPPEQRGEAIRKMFYETEELQKKAADPEAKEPVTKTDYENKARAIVDEYKGKRREATLQTVKEVTAGTIVKPDADTEKLLTAKGYSMRDVEETAKKYGISQAQVIEKLKAKK